MADSQAQKWIAKWPVDDNSRAIFLAAPQQVQRLVMSRGSLGSAGSKNVSAILMGRLRVAHQGWIPVPELDIHCQPSLVIFFRGEGSRAGGHGVHETEQSLAGFERNLRSFLVHHLQPLLEQGEYAVYIMADVKLAPGLEEGAKKLMQDLFGAHLTQFRFQRWLRGTDQVNSFMSAFDTFSQWQEERAFLSGCIGVYFFRIDVELKTKGMDLWPKDRICFLWRTAAMGSETTANDVLFYVPCDSLIVFRATVAQCRDGQNLHWVSDVPEVTSVLWLEYDFNHPSNTQKSSNPRY